MITANKKILLINDDASIRDLVQMYLELKHYQVYQASNGIKGLEEAKKIIPDLILLDVVMPEMNGYEVCQKLKQDKITKDIPVLFLSSLLETNEKIKGLESGGVDFITNTADYAEILARVETHLKIKELNQQLQESNHELTLKQKALNEDLHAAALIQQSLLPVPSLTIPNLDVSWSCYPCELVGGDICSINQLNEKSSVFYVLDVSGHGVPSAMITVSITQYLQQNQFFNSSPKQVLASLNQEYPFEKFNMFFTIFYMVLDNQAGRLTYSSAGHPPAVYLSPKKPLELLEAQGALIGLTEDSSFEEKEKTVEEGDKVILYTDGITEFHSPTGELYGNERFYTLLEKIKSHSVKEIIQLVSDELKVFGGNKAPRDDVSILAIQFTKKNLTSMS